MIKVNKGFNYEEPIHPIYRAITRFDWLRISESEHIEREENIDKISFFSLARRFVDETMDHKSEILAVLKQLEKELKKENERKE